jgi:hypothetical protein
MAHLIFWERLEPALGKLGAIVGHAVASRDQAENRGIVTDQLKTEALAGASNSFPSLRK